MNELLAGARAWGKVYYSATDSIHCDQAGLDQLKDADLVGDNLGQLQIKGTWPTADYRGIGDYTLGREVTRSGLPAGANPGCPFCRVPLLQGVFRCEKCKQPWDKKTYWYTQKESADQIIGHGPKDGVLIQGLIIQLESGYDFGVVGEDGWVKPLWESRENER